MKDPRSGRQCKELTLRPRVSILARQELLRKNELFEGKRRREMGVLYILEACTAQLPEELVGRRMMLAQPRTF
jgi:hypothetical protein